MQILKRFIFTKRAPPTVCQSASEAISNVKNNDLVYVHGVASTPSTLLKGEYIMK